MSEDHLEFGDHGEQYDDDEPCDPCPVCGCEVRTPAGYLQCECPAPFPQEPTFGSPGVVEQAAEAIRGFTPGPWCAVPHDPGELRLKRRFWQIGQEHEPNKGVGFAFGDDDANARLMASAPDLLAERDRLRAEVEGLREDLETARIHLQEQISETKGATEEWKEAVAQRDELADALTAQITTNLPLPELAEWVDKYGGEPLKSSIAALRLAGRLGGKETPPRG